MVMQKKQKKRLQQITDQLTKQLDGDTKTSVYDLAKLEQAEKERDKELATLSLEVKQMLDTFKTKCDKMEREVGNMIKGLAEDLRAQFLKEKRPLLITCICRIISDAVAGKDIVSDRHIRRLLGERSKDPLQRMRALHRGQESADELDPKDIKDAAQNPKNAAEYKTEEIAAVNNPITLKQIAQVKSRGVDFLTLEIEELKKNIALRAERDLWKKQAECWMEA